MTSTMRWNVDPAPMPGDEPDPRSRMALMFHLNRVVERIVALTPEMGPVHMHRLVGELFLVEHVIDGVQRELQSSAVALVARLQEAHGIKGPNVLDWNPTTRPAEEPDPPLPPGVVKLLGRNDPDFVPARGVTE
ncbi:MAG: hypothetical protein ACREME_10390 [Gemmatimonadales bacterium]